jgi:hypothetical protein
VTVGIQDGRLPVYHPEDEDLSTLGLPISRRGLRRGRPPREHATAAPRPRPARYSLISTSS